MKRKKPPPDEELRYVNSDSPTHQQKLKPSSPWGDSPKDSSNNYQTTQESPVIHDPKNLQEQLNFFRLQNPNLNSFEKLIPGSILGGPTVAPFWSEYTQAISNALTPLIPDKLSDLENQVLRGYASKQDANSWFSMTVTPLKKGNSLKISCPSSLGCLLGYTGTEPKISPKKPFKKTSRNSTTKTTPNAVKKIRIYPGKELHQLWKQWLAAYRWIYNWTIAYLRKEPNLSAFSLQKLARHSNRPDWVKELPGHQLQEAVADAVDAYKQARANQGTASFKSCRAFSQVIKFKAGNFKNGTWYCQRTKGLAFKSVSEFPQQCPYGTQLLYQKGKWFGCFPEYREPTPTEQERVIALDPGVRTFLTGYDGETILEIGQNDIGRINRLCTHLDQLMSKIALSPKKRQRYKMRKAATLMRSQIQNLVKDLHNKSASFLVNNYKLIFLPTFETSQMVSRQTRKIRSKTARNMLTWSHYKFAKHLEQMAARNGVMVVRCNESFTSKTCSECGHIHAHLGGNKIFRCPECGYEAPRDWNGGRSVMLRSLQAAAFTIVGDAILFLNLLSDE